MNDRKILVTGSKGQLGSEIQLIKDRFGSDLIFTDIDELDLCNASSLEKFFAETKIGFCINCAAYTAVDLAEKEINKAISINATAVKNLAEICNIHKTVLIHISTDFVYDGTHCHPYNEDDKPRPVNVYGQTKLEGEIQALKENPATIILRTSWLYSSFGKNFVKTMINLGKGHESLKVIFDQVGSPTYAGDLALALLKIIQDISADPSKINITRGIYHYSNEGVASWYDFAVEIFDLYGINCAISPIRSEEYPTPARRPHFSVLDKNKIKLTFGVQIPYWKSSLKKCIEKIKSAEN